MAALDRFSSSTTRALRRAGWFSGRVDPYDYSAAVVRLGWPAVPVALDFLREFGGLSLVGREFRILGVPLGRRRCRGRFGVVDVEPPVDDAREGTQNPLARVGACVPVGEANGWGEVFVMDTGGRVYTWYPWDEPTVPRLRLDAESGNDFVERLWRGRRLERYFH